MKIGEKVDDFTLPMTGDKGEFSLSEAQDQIVVLYFYPKDDTPGCTLQGKAVTALLPEFDRLGAVVLGVSRDGLKSHEKFRAKFGYVHHLLADTEALLCERFGVLREKNLYGKKVIGISRSTFVLNRSRVLCHEWRDIKSVEGHTEAVLNAVRELAENE